MNTRKIAAGYRLAHWAQIMQDRKDSGLSVKAYCEQAGFHENNYYYWQRKLRESTCEELAKIQGGSTSLTSAAFAEVKLATRDGLPPMAAGTRNQVCIESTGVRIIADSGYPEDKLSYLLRALVQPC